MGEIEAKFIDVLEDESIKKNDSLIIKEFEKAARLFDELVEKGLIKPRGYNLMSISDAPIIPGYND